MSEPKFHVGQAVAVCAADLSIVIPATVVTALMWYSESHIRNEKGVLIPAILQWMYTVEGYAAPDGGKFWFGERLLRPIDPDTEYQSTEELEKTV